MKIEFLRIRELLDTSLEVSSAVGRVELQFPRLILINPNSPVER